MQHWYIWLIAAASTAICLLLWFRDVRRIMRDRRSMVDSAASQLAACREKVAAAGDGDPAAAEVWKRSEDIYQQAVDLYQSELRRTWVQLPAALMGFRAIPQETEEKAKEPTPQKERYFGSVRFFKNLILVAVIIMIAAPTALAVYFGGNLQNFEARLQSQREQTAALQAENEALAESLQQEQLLREEAEAALPEPEPEPEPENPLEAETPYQDLYPDFYAPQTPEPTLREAGTIYLTFDDGPSPRTKEILDILKEKDAKATFFVIGSKGEANEALLRRIVEEGHALGMHSYSHNYGKIYASVEDYLADMYQIFTQIRDVTGVTPTVFRFPGGSINGYNGAIYQDLISEMMRRGFMPYDWNISSEDAAINTLVPAERLRSNVVTAAGRVQRGIVLMHDSAAKTTTVQALSPMIDGLREQGFVLKALTADVVPILYSYKD